MKHALYTLILLLAGAAHVHAQSLSSQYDQVFHAGDPGTSAAPFKIICFASYITATQDIRVIIPASHMMEWDTAITSVTITGNASYKVSSTVSYPDKKTLLIDVTTTFIANEFFRVYGTRFANFSGLAIPGNLILDYTGEGEVDEVDVHTITIGGAPTISSAENQAFNMGDPATPISPITITDHAIIPGILADKDIRIRIPPGFGMAWDTTDTTAEITGGNVATTVSYEDGGKTLVLDVTSDFPVSWTVVVSGLKFTGFSTGVPTSRLEIEVNDQGTIAGVDEKEISIFDVVTLASVNNQVFAVNGPPATISTITVRNTFVTSSITSSNDFQLRIPTGFNAVWDTTTVPSFSITGGGEVGSTVHYLPGGKILQVNVTRTFSPGDVLTISGLKFKDFTAPSAPDNLVFAVYDTNNFLLVQVLDKWTIGVRSDPVISSISNQLFVFGSPPTAISPITVTDAAGVPLISGKHDIRIHIPAQLGMTWFAKDTTAVITGGASVKVSSQVSFEDQNRTLVIKVTEPFAPEDQIIVSGLSLGEFTVVATGYLTLLVQAVGADVEVDDKTKMVGPAPLFDIRPTISSNSDQLFTVGDPVATLEPIKVVSGAGNFKITVDGDIRILIPESFNAIWDVLHTTPTFSGNAAGKVESVVTYEDSRTVLIDVKAPFGSEEELSIDDLKLIQFSAGSPDHNLWLETSGGDNPPEAVDDKTITIRAPTISSDADLTVITGAGSTPIVGITITDDPDNASITAANDIRIAIPPGLDIVWDFLIFAADFKGTADGKISSVVGFEGAGKILVIDVLSDFAAGDTLMIKDLAFTVPWTPPPSLPSTGSLELMVNPAGTAAAVDDKIIILDERPTISSAGTGDADSDGRIDFLTITFSKGVIGPTSLNLGAGFRLDGYTILSGNIISSTVVVLTLEESGFPDSGATPDFHYDSSVGDVAEDVNWIPLADYPGSAVTDKAPPVIIGVSSSDTDSDGYLDTVVFTFSEPLLAGQEDLGDWSLVDADKSTNLLTGAAVLISGNTVTLTLADNSGTTGTPAYRYKENGSGGSLQDVAGNGAGEETNNSPPNPYAGPDRTTDPTRVVLDGSASSDPDGMIHSYSWVQIGGMIATLNDPAESIAWFDILDPGVYTFALTVSDGLVTRTDSVTITVNNVPPTADAGFDRNVNVGDTVVLDASGSSDGNGNGDIVSYTWDPEGGIFPTPTFMANAAGVTVITLTVTDSAGNTDTDTITIRVNGILHGVPTAHAGVDQNVTVGSPVTFEGEMSTDPDGDSLGFSWSGPNPFKPTAPGITSFLLTVNDGIINSVPDEVSILAYDPANHPPEAVAVRTSPSGDVVVGDGVTLSGSGSSDPEGAPLAWSWIQTGGPRTALSNGAAAQPTFVPILAGNYRFELVVDDGTQASRAVTVEIPVKLDGGATLPNAVATIDPASDPDGDGRVFSAPSEITITGTGSTGSNVAYNWVQVRGPCVTLDNGTAVAPKFTPSRAGTYSFALHVTDDNGVRDSDTVIVVIDTSNNEPPTSNAGADQTAVAGTLVMLDGTGSFDSATSIPAFFWEQISGPPVALSDDSSATPSFTPPASGTYLFRLVVHDGIDSAAPDDVTVVVSSLFAIEDSGGGGCSARVPPGFGSCLFLFGLLILFIKRRAE